MSEASDKLRLLEAIACDPQCASAVRVANVLVNRVLSATGTCKLPHARIAGLLGVSRDTVERAITLLVKLGYFERLIGQGVPTPSGPANAYRPIYSAARARLAVVERGADLPPSLPKERRGGRRDKRGASLPPSLPEQNESDGVRVGQICPPHDGATLPPLIRPVEIRPIKEGADADAPVASPASDNPEQGGEAPARMLPGLAVGLAAAPKKAAKPKQRAGRGRGALAKLDGWKPRDETRANIRQRYPGIDPDDEERQLRFVRNCRAKAIPAADYDPLFENWCGDDFKRLPRQRAAAAAGDKPRRALVAGSAAWKAYYDD